MEALKNTSKNIAQGNFPPTKPNTSFAKSSVKMTATTVASPTDKSLDHLHPFHSLLTGIPSTASSLVTAASQSSKQVQQITQGAAFSSTSTNNFYFPSHHGKLHQQNLLLTNSLQKRPQQQQQQQQHQQQLRLAEKIWIGQSKNFQKSNCEQSQLTQQLNQMTYSSKRNSLISEHLIGSQHTTKKSFSIELMQQQQHQLQFDSTNIERPQRSMIQQQQNQLTSTQNQEILEEISRLQQCSIEQRDKILRFEKRNLEQQQLLEEKEEIISKAAFQVQPRSPFTNEKTTTARSNANNSNLFFKSSSSSTVAGGDIENFKDNTVNSNRFQLSATQQVSPRLTSNTLYNQLHQSMTNQEEQHGQVKTLFSIRSAKSTSESSSPFRLKLKAKPLSIDFNFDLAKKIEQKKFNSLQNEKGIHLDTSVEGGIQSAFANILTRMKRVLEERKKAINKIKQKKL